MSGFSSGSMCTLLQELQEEINQRLSQLSDLSVECDRFAERESLPQAENLRAELASLQV